MLRFAKKRNNFKKKLDCNTPRITIVSVSMNAAKAASFLTAKKAKGEKKMTTMGFHGLSNLKIGEIKKYEGFVCRTISLEVEMQDAESVEFRTRKVYQEINLYGKTEEDLMTEAEKDEMRELEEMARHHEEEEAARLALIREVA